jgi:hypothetical protein
VPNGESEKLVDAVADRVREALAEAERRAEEITDEATRRAEEILAEAEARAKEIEAEAGARAAKTVALSEDQARERIERARRALDELGVALGSSPGPASEELDAPNALPVPGPEPEPEPKEGSDPSPEETPEPAEPPGSDPSEPDEPADESAEEPDPERDPDPGKPTTDELIAQLKGAEAAAKSSGGGGDQAAARLVAMNMALDGASREDVEQRMADEFGLADADAMLDEVFERAGRRNERP